MSTRADRHPETNLICPECGQPAQQRPPRFWVPANGSPPQHSHLDGEPLCPIIGRHSYEPAQPVDQGGDPAGDT